jgi:outer membrane murein-binding lipoprotein Lpp
MVSGTAVIPFAALILTGCVSQSAYDQQAAQLQQVQAQAAAQQAEIAKMQAENKWVVAGDLLFPEGGYQLGPNGQAALNQYVRGTGPSQANSRVRDHPQPHMPRGAIRQRRSVSVGPTTSCRIFGRRVSTPISCRPKVSATHPVAPNDTPQGRAQNRHIEIVTTGPGA